MTGTFEEGFMLARATANTFRRFNPMILVLAMALSSFPAHAQTDRQTETGVVAEQAPGSRTQSKTWWVLPQVGSLTQGLGSLSARLPALNIASWGEDIREGFGSVFPGSFSARLKDLYGYWLIAKPLIETALDQLQKNFITLQRWEYRVIDVPEPAAAKLEEQLNRM